MDDCPIVHTRHRVPTHPELCLNFRPLPVHRPSFYVKRGGRQFKGCLVVGKKHRAADEDDEEDDDTLTPVVYHPEPPYTDLPQAGVDIPANLSENTPRSRSQKIEMVASPGGSSATETAQGRTQATTPSFMESLESAECSSSSEGDCCSTYSAIQSSASSGVEGQARRTGMKSGNLSRDVGGKGEEKSGLHGDGEGHRDVAAACETPRPSPLAARVSGDACGAASKEPQESATQGRCSRSKDRHEALGSIIEPDCEMRGPECGGERDPEDVGQEALERLAEQLGRLPESMLDGVIVHLLTTLEPDTWPALAGCEPL
eukprot:evm.model.scf_151.14 EVM.evm.TU.scf_151.14   scf_151:104777-107409(+)